MNLLKVCGIAKHEAASVDMKEGWQGFCNAVRAIEPDIQFARPVRAINAVDSEIGLGLIGGIKRVGWRDGAQARQDVGVDLHRGPYIEKRQQFGIDEMYAVYLGHTGCFPLLRRLAGSTTTSLKEHTES